MAMIATLIGQPARLVRVVSSSSASATPCDVAGAYGKKTSWLSRMSLAGSPSARAAGAIAADSTTRAASEQASETRMRDIIAPRARDALR